MGDIILLIIAVISLLSLVPLLWHRKITATCVQCFSRREPGVHLFRRQKVWFHYHVFECEVDGKLCRLTQIFFMDIPKHVGLDYTIFANYKLHTMMSVSEIVIKSLIAIVCIVCLFLE